MPSNKFSISLSKLDYQPEPQIHFLTHVPKVLSIADAEILVSELREVLDSAKPKPGASFTFPEAASSEPEVTMQAEVADKSGDFAKYVEEHAGDQDEDKPRRRK